jgi:phosphate butyryltransferase
MRFQNYDELTRAIKARAKKVPFAIVRANESHTMEAVVQSCRDGLIEPHFIGDPAEIRTMLQSFGMNPADYEIIDQDDPALAAQTAVELVHNGTVKGIMKGKLETGQLMKVLLKSDNKLRTSSVVCAMSLMEVPHYHKLIAASDPALCIYPTLEDKTAILRNAVTALTNIGIDMPKVAVLAAVETPNPKMPETMDAVELKRMNQEGKITGCLVDGPLSYDLCMDPEAARIKGSDSPVAGDPDLIIYPNLVVGNAVSKALVLSAGAVGSSVILGTAVPVVLPSRSASVAEKARNILLAAAST